MKLHELVDSSDLTRCLAEKLISRKKHPTENLYIYNYTQRAQFTPDWTETMELCRGLIVDGSSTIVARGFRKFWNYNDSRHPETLAENLPKRLPEITVKYDGSLGVGYQVNGKLRIATRGSFTSAQALWASRWVRANFMEDLWDPGWTPLFEIVYPENRIVVDYPFSGLVLLALVDTETGEEASEDEMLKETRYTNMRCAEKVESCDLKGLLAADQENAEGYVASWPRPGTTPLRVKIKLETYCMLHRLYTACSVGTIWEALSEGRDGEDQIKNGTNEFKQWFYAERTKLQQEYERLILKADDLFNAGPNPMLDEDDRAFRKKFAEYAVAQGRMSGVLFAMLDQKDIRPMVWKMLKPVGVQPVFKPEQAE